MERQAGGNIAGQPPLPGLCCLVTVEGGKSALPLLHLTACATLLESHPSSSIPQSRGSLKAEDPEPSLGLAAAHKV